MTLTPSPRSAPTPLVVVVTPMPESAVTDSPPSGVALYSASLLATYSGDTDVAVLAQRQCVRSSLAPRVTVIPTWRPGYAGVWDVVSTLRRLRPRVIHLQHELRLYGGIMPTLALVFCLNWFRWRNAHVVITLHGVPRLDDVASQHLLPTFLGSAWLAQPLMASYLRLVLCSCDSAVVLSDVFRRRLLSLFPAKHTKVHVVPLGVRREQAPVRRGRTAVPKCPPHALAFGFLTSYKSPELILDACELGLLDDFQVTLSVASNPRAAGRSMALRHRALRARASRLPQVTWREFLSDTELAHLLRMANVLILPYTACVAASGVAAMAEDANLPIAYSKPLEELFGRTRASFELTPYSLAVAVRAAARGDVEIDTPHASWAEVAQATVALWPGTHMESPGPSGSPAHHASTEPTP